MMHKVNLKEVKSKEIHRLSNQFYGKDPNGNELGFNNYYMEINGKAFFAIGGECHYSRVNESKWEDTILKMKAGGINIVSTYIFWNHHEEIEGKFRFDGQRNVRAFVELCKKHKMFVIIRIGPFNHGEARNGGLPDWLYGKPFEVRSNTEEFLEYVRRLYRNLAKELKGLFYKDGGIIIGTQIENEYMHSAAPWEMTTGVTNEWIPSGKDGEAYMRRLKVISQEEGICTPFYTCTGWGGAVAPVDEMLPLWGGYAFWPWIFYNYKGKHPATPEYLYRDNHNNQVPKTYNFEPCYEPESLPYACCEMGGGMSCFYNYRFQFPYESVDAMANIKLAGGCNFLGYYMYRGGSNPTGESIPYLNECQCPKISYDYQAAIGEFGQIRNSYHRLRVLHLFVKGVQESLCKMTTWLPENSQEIDAEDTKTLRYAVRTDGKSGFLFLNNYQDHVVCEAKKNETIQLELKEKTIEIEGISLAAGEEAVLPFGMEIEGMWLNYAKAQLLTSICNEGEMTYFFFAPEGMQLEYSWSGVEKINGEAVQEDTLKLNPIYQNGIFEQEYIIEGRQGKARIVSLTRKQSLCFYKLDIKGQNTAILSSEPITFDGECIKVESQELENTIRILTYPQIGKNSLLLDDNISGKIEKIEEIEEGIWSGIEITMKKEKCKSLSIQKISDTRYIVELPESLPKSLLECKQMLLQIEYKGDIGQAFIDGILIADNFSNLATWEIGLGDIWNRKMGRKLTIVITPLKENVEIDVSSTMAGRVEKEGDTVAELFEVRLKPIYEIAVHI